MAGAGGLTPTEELRRAAAPHLPDSPRVVALSGGADSAVCAWLSAGDDAHPTRAVHVHHGGPHSDRLEQAARQVAEALDLDLDVISVEVPAGPSYEASAREVRLAAIADALKPGETAMSGHTADDLAETVLLNLVRGAGARGLAGIPRGRAGWRRPLLGIGRREVRRVAEELGLPYYDDPDNAGDGNRRNVLRNRLLPQLATLNPDVVGAVGRTATLLGADDAVLDGAAAGVPLTFVSAGVKLPRALLQVVEAPVAARAVRRALRSVRGPYGGSEAETSSVLAVASGARVAATLGDGWQVTGEGPWVAITSPLPDPVPRPLAVPGATEFWAGRIDAALVDAPPVPRALGTATATLPVALLGSDAVVRPARRGDRVAMRSGSKRVVAALAEAGVPVRLRRRWPVVESGGKIAWVVAVRPAFALPGGAAPLVTVRARLEEQ